MKGSIINTARQRHSRNSAAVMEFIGQRRRLIAERCRVSPEKSGLEISPNWAPLVLRGEAQMVYCDRLSQEELEARERDNKGRINLNAQVEEMDFVWKDGTSLPSYFAPEEKFDFVVSSHVMEHVPNLLGFLTQQRELCKPGGLVSFVVPDVRLSGEYFRPLTTPAQLIEAFLLNRDKPSPGMVYEASYHIFDWPGVANLKAKHVLETKRGYTTDEAMFFARHAMDHYVDVHCWSFTHATIGEIFRELQEAKCFDFEIVAIDQIAEEIVCTLKARGPSPAEQHDGGVLEEIKALEARLSELRSRAACANA